MLKKTITYEGMDGSDVTEDFYFHLSKANLMELNWKVEGGFKAMLAEITAAQTGKPDEEKTEAELAAEQEATHNAFKKIVLVAVGKKSSDGKHFLKSDDIRGDFENTEAFSELLFSLMADENVAAAFINGLMPRGFVEQVSAAITVNKPYVPAVDPSREGLAGTPFVPSIVPTEAAVPESSNEFDKQKTMEGNKVMTQTEAQALMGANMPEFTHRMQSGWNIIPDAQPTMTTAEAQHLMASDLPEFQKRMQIGWEIKG